jgi:hypothetical protein
VIVFIGLLVVLMNASTPNIFELREKQKFRIQMLKTVSMELNAENILDSSTSTEDIAKATLNEINESEEVLLEKLTTDYDLKTEIDTFKQDIHGIDSFMKNMIVSLKKIMKEEWVNELSENIESAKEGHRKLPIVTEFGKMKNLIKYLENLNQNDSDYLTIISELEKSHQITEKIYNELREKIDDFDLRNFDKNLIKNIDIKITKVINLLKEIQSDKTFKSVLELNIKPLVRKVQDPTFGFQLKLIITTLKGALYEDNDHDKEDIETTLNNNIKTNLHDGNWDWKSEEENQMNKDIKIPEAKQKKYQDMTVFEKKEKSRRSLEKENALKNLNRIYDAQINITNDTNTLSKPDIKEVKKRKEDNKKTAKIADDTSTFLFKYWKLYILYIRYGLIIYAVVSIVSTIFPMFIMQAFIIWIMTLIYLKNSNK